MRESIKWLGLFVLVIFMIRAMVPLIPTPINVNEPIHIIRTVAFFGISLLVTGTFIVAALTATRSKKN